MQKIVERVVGCKATLTYQWRSGLLEEGTQLRRPADARNLL